MSTARSYPSKTAENNAVQQGTYLAAAAVVAVPALWLGYKAYRRLVRKTKPLSEGDCLKWTTQEVAQWMTSKKFSAECVKAMVENDVDGDTLVRLEAEHLAAMRISKMKDRILFERLVQPLRVAALGEAAAQTASSGEDDEPVARPKTATPKAPKERDVLVSNATEKDQEKEEMQKIMVALMQQLQAIYKVCSSEQFLHGDPETQRKTIALSKQKLEEVSTITAMLPPAQQENVKPLVMSLSQLIAKVEEGLSEAGPAPPARTTPVVDARTQQSLDKLQAMLAGFMESICSDDAAALPMEDKRRLTQNITVQVSKIMQALQALPTALSEPVVAQCREVLRLSEELLNRPTAGHGNARGQRLGAQGSDAAAQPVTRASLEFLVSRLRAVFEALRSPKTLELATEPRLQLIEQMESDVSSVAEEAQHLPEKDRQILVQVLQNVVSVLQQIKMITLEEQKMRMLKSAAAEQQKQQQQAPAAPMAKAEAGSLSVEEVSNAIRSVLTMLKSPKFVEAPAEVQQAVATRMLQQLESLGIAVKESMGPAEQQHLVPMISKVAQLVATVVKQDTQAASAPKSNNDNRQQEQGAQSDPEVSEDFLKIVATLKQVFEMVNSKQFQSAPAGTRQKIAGELLQHVRSVEDGAKALPQQHRTAVQEMVSPLLRLLTAVAAMPPSRAAPPRNEEQEQEQEEEGQEASSTEAFSAIISSLQEVFEVVNSDGFKNAPEEAQKEVALQLQDHVRKLAAHFSSLSAEERATVNRFVEPLEQLLAAIVAQGDRSTTSRSTATTQANNEEDEQENDDDAAASADDSEAVSDAKATYAVISKLQKLYAVAQSDKFLEAGPAQQQRIASMIRGELEKLERESTSLPSAQRMQVLPLIRQLGQLLANFSQGSFVEDVEEDDEDNNNDSAEKKRNPQDLEDRVELFERAVDSVMQMRSRTISFEELQDMLQLLDELDAAGIASQQEITIRQALHEAIKLSIRKIQKEQGLEVDDGEEEGQKDDEEEEEDDEENNGGSGMTMELFTRFFVSLLQLLRSSELKNTRQLIPFTERIESSLNDADTQGIDWRHNAAAFRAVTDVLSEVQNVQQRLQSNGPSEIEQVLRSATADVLKEKPATIGELAPYLELLDKLAQMQDQMTIEDLQAYQELQKAVILVRDGIVRVGGKSPASSQQNSPMSRSKTENRVPDLQSPMFTTAVPPNTPSAGISKPPPLDEDEEEEEEEGEDLDEELEEAEDDDDQEPTQEDVMIGEMLFQIYQKLQRERHTNEQLAPFERVIQQIRANSPTGRVRQILDAVEELIERHRAVNDEEQSRELLSERQKAEDMLRKENERQSPSKAAAAQDAAAAAAQNANEEHSIDEDEAADAANEGIVDGLSNQLALLPRILERLNLPDFMQTTTLFEIQCVGRILVHLGEARTVMRNESLREAVARAKKLFGEHMQLFQGSVKDGSAVTCAMKLTGMSIELEGGEHLTQYTIIGAEEEEYTINEAFIAKLDGNALEVGQPAAETEEQWKSNSRCIIFSIQQYPEGPDNATSLSELTMLVDVLDVHGFDITSVPAEGITAQDALDVIRSVINERPSRLLIYYNTPYPDSIAPEMHAITFCDGSTLPHRQVAALCKGAVERAVIVHDQTRRLEVAAARNGALAPYVSIALTEGAAQIANTSRCWLFDGLFTPAVVETISGLASGYLCPEELITGPLGQLMGKTISQGSFSDEPALKMAFFAATD